MIYLFEVFVKSGNLINIRVELPSGMVEWLEKKRCDLGVSDKQLIEMLIKEGIKQWRNKSP